MRSNESILAALIRISFVFLAIHSQYTLDVEKRQHAKDFSSLFVHSIRSRSLFFFHFPVVLFVGFSTVNFPLKSLEFTPPHVCACADKCLSLISISFRFVYFSGFSFAFAFHSNPKSQCLPMQSTLISLHLFDSFFAVNARLLFAFRWFIDSILVFYVFTLESIGKFILYSLEALVFSSAVIFLWFDHRSNA